MAYTKLFSDILDSTIWQTPLHVKVVWITMLAMCDRDGEVRASVPGLGIRAGVTLEQCEEALGVLMSPDRYSRTPDHEGRRIYKIDGGWKLINHDKYRAKMDADDLREKAAIRQQRKREREASEASRSVTPCHASSRDVTPVTLGHAESQPSREVTTSDQIRSDSDQNKISDALTADPETRKTPGEAKRMTSMNETARFAVLEAARARGTAAPQACSYPDHKDWCDLSRWAVEVERNRPEVPAEEALTFAVTEWLQTDASKHGFSPQWLARNPNEYFLAECIARRAKGRELAAQRVA